MAAEVVSLIYLALCVLLGAVVAVLNSVFTSPARDKPLLCPVNRQRAGAAGGKAAAEVTTVDVRRSKRTVNRALDEPLNDMVDYIVRDSFLSWYGPLSAQGGLAVSETVKDELFAAIRALYRASLRIDPVSFFCLKLTKLLSTHFHKLNNLQVSFDALGSQATNPFKLHVCLRSEEDEVSYYRKLAETIMIQCVPRATMECKMTRLLIREILTKNVIQHTINTLCQPWYINSCICGYLERLQTAKVHVDRVSKYKDFNHFMQSIDHCDNLEVLNGKKQRIINEINQAEMLKILKEESGKKSMKKGAPKMDRRVQSRADRLMELNLPKYINQLILAKGRVESRIRDLGGADWADMGTSGEWHSVEMHDAPGVARLRSAGLMATPIPTRIILKSEEGFDAFLQHASSLQPLGQEKVLQLWKEVEKLRGIKAIKSLLHQADEIYHKFVQYNTNKKIFQIPQEIQTQMWQYLLGNEDIEGFFRAQEYAMEHINNILLPSFLVSALYRQWVANHRPEMDLEELQMEQSGLVFLDEEDSMITEEALRDQNAYQQVMRLREVQDKIARKERMKYQLKTSSNRNDHKLYRELIKELQQLKAQEDELKRLIEDIHSWYSNAGRYTVRILDCSIMPEMTLEQPSLMMQISTGNADMNGHIITKTLSDLQKLHEQLKLKFPWCKNMDLPKTRRFRSYDTEYCSTATLTVEKYLQSLLSNTDICLDEDRVLFNFIRKSHVIHSASEDLKDSFMASLSTLDDWDSGSGLARGISIMSPQEEATDNDLLAEPIFALIDEVFDLRAMLRLFRTSLMTFLRSRYHMTVGKRIKDVLDWAISDSMLRYYLENLKESMWPGGTSGTPLKKPSPDEEDALKQRTIQLLKDWVHTNRDDAYALLLGERHLSRGIIKIFNGFQDVKINKHVMITSIELFLVELIAANKNRNDLDLSQVDNC